MKASTNELDEHGQMPMPTAGRALQLPTAKPSALETPIFLGMVSHVCPFHNPCHNINVQTLQVDWSSFQNCLTHPFGASLSFLSKVSMAKKVIHDLMPKFTEKAEIPSSLSNFRVRQKGGYNPSFG